MVKIITIEGRTATGFLRFLKKHGFKEIDPKKLADYMVDFLEALDAKDYEKQKTIAHRVLEEVGAKTEEEKEMVLREFIHLCATYYWLYFILKGVEDAERDKEDARS